MVQLLYFSIVIKAKSLPETQINHGYVRFAELMESKPAALDFPYKQSLCLKEFQPLLEQVDHIPEEKRLAYAKLKAAFADMIPDTENLSYWSDLPKDLQAHFVELYRLLFPVVPGIDLLGFVGQPYDMNVMFATQGYKDTFLNSDLAVEVTPALLKEKRRNSIIRAGLQILREIYDVKVEFDLPEVFAFRSMDTGLDRYFGIQVDFRYTYVVVHGDKPKLSNKQIQQVLKTPDNEELWLELLPPEKFSFRGFTVGQFVDVTRVEIISILKDMMVEITDLASPLVIRQGLLQLVRSFLRMPEIEMGISENLGHHGVDLPNDFGLLPEGGLSASATFAKGTIHRKVLKKDRPYVYDSKEELHQTGGILLNYAEAGFESIILIPLAVPEGKPTVVLELASKEKARFTGFHAMELQEFGELLALSAEGAIAEMEKQVNLIIQKNYTSLHPSVRWRFEEVVAKNWWKQNGQVDPEKFEAIVFENVHPLYGQADIVGSSKRRNQAICHDLSKNLQMAEKLLAFYQERINFHLLDVYQVRIGRFLESLKAHFNTSDENIIVAFLDNELHPIVRQLSERYQDLLREVTKQYFNRLDPRLHIVYEERKAYEESVSQINQLIGGIVERGDHEMQEVLPHYFEHYKTDGVEYNMYLGAALHPEGLFSDQYLQNFRLWQLVNTAELTRAVMAAKEKMPVPLETAQLVFVYNHPLSIRFRMDEKRFDVDGTYNVRYEILKKRIDKATVLGTGERLTLANKIAIVYLEDKDKREYMEYLDYLREKGYIDENIEDLQLDKLQGAEGLRALRVTVIPSK